MPEMNKGSFRSESPGVVSTNDLSPGSPTAKMGFKLVVALVLGVAAFIVATVIILGVYGRTVRAPSQTTTVVQPTLVVETIVPPKTYTKVIEVTDQPVRVEIPFGYKMEYSWGYAPLDTRTDISPEWIDTEKVPAHIEGGQMVQWREWRVNRKYGGKATVTCVFTEKRGG